VRPECASAPAPRLSSSVLPGGDGEGDDEVTTAAPKRRAKKTSIFKIWLPLLVAVALLVAEGRAAVEDEVALLTSLGATRAHSGRTLLEHLEGTARILSSWAEDGGWLPAHAIKAARFHSVYGCSKTDPALVPKGDPRIIPAIGPDAERLCSLYSDMDRPSFFAAVLDGPVCGYSEAAEVTRESCKRSITFRAKDTGEALTAHALEALALVGILWAGSVDIALTAGRDAAARRSMPEGYGVLGYRAAVLLLPPEATSQIASLFQVPKTEL
jgi:hypothetical protein